MAWSMVLYPFEVEFDEQDHMNSPGKANIKRPSGLKIKPAKVLQNLVDFLIDRVEGRGFDGVVLGISGGVDSAVSAAIAVRALGPKRVTGLFMPYAESNPQSVKDAGLLAGRLKIELLERPLTPFADSFFAAVPMRSRVRKGNVLARLRMICLFDHSHKTKRLVLGASNKTEILLGYGTWYGDTACSINAIGGLYKTQVWQLARSLKIPKSIIDKPPSADLWPGQTDEDELGVTYALADQILYRLYDQGKTAREVQDEGFAPPLVRLIVRLVRANRFKSQPPEIAQLTCN